MTKKFIILCGRYRFFFFLIVLPWFGHVFSNKGRFGHKRKLPGFFYFLTCHHQANLRRHTTPCRHSADLPAWWKSKGSLGANVHSAERTGSCKQAPSNVCMLGFLLPGGKQLEAAYPRALQAFNFQIWH